ncbi:MAG TPA: hypothetical protein VN848_07255 [Gemmatimonadales bacterium]|nr:hypothetical protein [Gemmatimonadales bacterium]
MEMLIGTYDGPGRADLSRRIPEASWSALALVPGATTLVLRMVTNPNLLEPGERVTLVEQLREAVADRPEVADLRVLLGMALCVNYDAQAAIHELNTAVQLAPESFIAQLKMGELWMRLRVCDKAEEHTKRAERLAQNWAQADLARRQSVAIRTMRRKGIERGGYHGPLAFLGTLKGRLFGRRRTVPVTLDVRAP